jgi:GalNAc-alpha-(1->4)-GalNAc-alpha-(1->3)-diNAcBac-PP-undecaprenol alpha-1,4-N-acetyl-D-galactosaminyltransferase
LIKIALILPSLHAGGMEKVMVSLANFLELKNNTKVYLVVLIKSEKFYPVNSKVTLIEPIFPISPTFKGKIGILKYLRSTLKEIKPNSILSFGSMYNSFVMLANIGLRNRIFLSDRSNPYRNSFKSFFNRREYINDGLMHYLLKMILYRYATGIIVQTEFAKKVEEEQLSHNNIIVIPNPIRLKVNKNIQKERIILNVGRFIKSKHQQELIKIFTKVRIEGWKLIFLGEGPEIENSKNLVSELKMSDFIKFKGNVNNIEDYYYKSEIFAFMSTSEGFPNALAEALMTPLASIAFDCVAGPSDLIENGHTGVLIPLNDFELYSKELKELMMNEQIREDYRNNSKEFMKKYNYAITMEKFYKVLTL